MMPVLEPIGDENVPAEAKEIFENFRAKIKMVPNIYRTMAHAPAVLKGSLGFNESFHSGLDAKLRELAYLKASTLTGCGY